MALAAVVAAVGAAVGVAYLGASRWRGDRPRSALKPGPEVAGVLRQIEELRIAGQTDRGLALAREALARDPRAPLLHFTAGMLLGAKGDLAAASAELEAETRLNPGFAEAHLALGVARAQRREFAEAVPAIEACLRLEPGRADALLALGRSLQELGRLAEAEKALDGAAAAGSNDAQRELGFLAARDGRFDAAVKALRRALEIDGSDLGTLFALGRALVRAGREEEGEQVLERHRALAAARERMDQLASTADVPGAPPRAFLALGDARFQEGDFTGAAEAYRRALGVDPALAPALLGLALSELERGDGGASAAMTERLLARDPSSSPGYLLLGLLELSRGRAAEAEERFERSRKLGTWGGRTWQRLGRAYQAAGRPQEALAAFRRAAELEPGSATILEPFARLLAASGRLEEASTVLEQAVKAAPADADLRMQHASLLLALGRRDPAEAALREAIRLQRATLFGPKAVDAALARLGELPGASQARELYLALRGASESKR